MTERGYAILFFIGVFLMSAGVSYAWWMKLRVLWLRQDIYDLRDSLFMGAARLGCTDDNAAHCARQHLNSLARIAPVISIPFVITAIKNELVEIRELPTSHNRRLNALIAETMQKADARISRYLTRETAFGWALVVLSRAVLMTWILQSLSAWVRQWRQSNAAEGAIRILEEDRSSGRWIAT